MKKKISFLLCLFCLTFFFVCVFASFSLSVPPFVLDFKKFSFFVVKRNALYQNCKFAKLYEEAMCRANMIWALRYIPQLQTLWYSKLWLLSCYWKHLLLAITFVKWRSWKNQAYIVVHFSYKYFQVQFTGKSVTRSSYFYIYITK